MEQSPPGEANSHSASQEIFRLLLNLNPEFRVQNISLLVPILNHTNRVHNLISCFF